jgi:hypothetical protein
VTLLNLSKLGTAHVIPEDLSIVWRPDTCIVPNFSYIESNINKQPSWYSARSSRHLAKCMHRIYSRRSYIYNLFQNIERNSPVFAFCFTLDSWTILVFWQAQNLLQSMMKHYCADSRGKKWFIDSHPVHSNVKPSKELCLSTCGVIKIFSILLTKSLLGPASHLAACSDASIQEQLWLA